MAVKPRTMDEYLAGLRADQRAALEKVRKAVRAAAPKAEECFSYGLPAFRLGGKLVAGFAAAAKHCAFYPMSGRTIGVLHLELAGYETSKGAVRFSAERGLPSALIRKLVKTRIAEIDDSAAGSRRPGARPTRRSGSAHRPARRRS
jgi:uncharacterized protein YdhG (YjbR/CyaY superfamily)